MMFLLYKNSINLPLVMASFSTYSRCHCTVYCKGKQEAAPGPTNILTGIDSKVPPIAVIWGLFSRNVKPTQQNVSKLRDSR